MIILLIILFTALVIIGFFYIKNKLVSWLIGVLSMLLLALSMAALAYHDSNHWGMKQVTTTSSQQIYSVGGSTQAFGTLIKQEIGTKSGNYIFIYKTSSSDTTDATVNFLNNTKTIDMTNTASMKSIQTFVEDKMKTNVVETSKKSATYKLTDTTQAQLVTKVTRWEFSSNFMETLFGIGGEAGELVKQQSTVEVPKDSWLVLTTAQAQELQAKAPAMQAQAQLAAAIAAAPTAEEKATIEAKAKAAMSPVAQLAQVKQLLGITD